MMENQSIPFVAPENAWLLLLWDRLDKKKKWYYIAIFGMDPHFPALIAFQIVYVILLGKDFFSTQKVYVSVKCSVKVNLFQHFL